MNKPKNVLVQCLATILIPTGLYAFKRINKLQKGILVYLSSYVLVFAGGLIQASSLYPWGLDILDASLMSFTCYLFSILVPIIFMSKYTRQYNEALKV